VSPPAYTAVFGKCRKAYDFAFFSSFYDTYWVFIKKPTSKKQLFFDVFWGRYDRSLGGPKSPDFGTFLSEKIGVLAWFLIICRIFVGFLTYKKFQS
jgi:hypothetical protein